MFEELSREVPPPPGWQEKWIERTSVTLDYYSNAVYFGLVALTMGILLAGWMSVRSCKKELTLSPTNRAEIFKKWDKKSKQSSKRLFYIAALFLVNAIVIQGVDTYIGFTSLQADAKAESAKPNGEWNSKLFTEIALYSMLLLVVWMATFFLFPLLQLFVVSSLLKRHGEKYKLDAVTNFIVAARSGTTYLTLIWSIAYFITIRWWVPTSHHSLLRFIASTAIFGSVMTWGDASIMFNFRTEILEDQEFLFAERNVREMMNLFRPHAKALRAKPADPEKLPLFVKADGDFQDEKVAS